MKVWRVLSLLFIIALLASLLTAPVSADGGWVAHLVKPGESLSGYARECSRKCWREIFFYNIFHAPPQWPRAVDGLGRLYTGRWIWLPCQIPEEPRKEPCQTHFVAGKIRQHPGGWIASVQDAWNNAGWHSGGDWLWNSAVTQEGLRLQGFEFLPEKGWAWLPSHNTGTECDPRKVYNPPPFTNPVLTKPTVTPPIPSTLHIVRPGETLTSIAQYYGLTVGQIMNNNNLTNPDYIWVGQRLQIR